MTSTVYTIVISGAGQLGSRYLQGLVKSRYVLQIYVQDVCDESLVLAKRRWDEALGQESLHEVSFHTSFDTLPRQLDIAIVATTADVRPQIVRKIAEHAAVRYWVLEKVLAQNEFGLDEILLFAGKCDGAWVNTPRRMMPWHQQIKAQLGGASPLVLEVSGGRWGLACNAIHFLDLLAWWTGETLQSIRTDGLGGNWQMSKRANYQEVLGVLEARFSGGSRAVLRDEESGAAISLSIYSGGNLLWQISESGGLASRADGLELPGRMSYQSEMAGTLVDSILEHGRCDLPTMTASIAMHRVFIREMQVHWVRAGNFGAICLPIT
jgi:hypothetical protein